MPRRTKRRKAAEEEHTHLAIRLERCDASVEAAINYNVYAPQSAWNSDDDDPLYRFTTRLTIGGISIYPEERAGDTYEVTIYSNNLGSGDIRATLKDVQERDEHGSPKYRQYHGRQIPIYTPPPGMGLIDKIRGEPRWTVWLRVSPRFTTDALALLSDGRSLFLAVRELKKGRRRWVQSVSLQTTDPAEE
ncbi:MULTISPECIES: hypothetical protein [unclassified Mesorhizobium]|uniref:hypothetical protein n=1 Tax=unclassified Mesorhizobium TaxID=325217 RepID=UPI001125FC01|nr:MULTISPECIES: hypothetical protein [unclassified Mesorhizobium]TPK52915.1 hypothetical protein FJ550_14550 [Mesorhizobium sp. B2-5-2]TPL14914.1 hypothetical protein FJ945_29745 [Mesorhizobium sp. B2-4-9]TPL21347.1 hypothetical protein FJ946_21460 [Mesorhizobium sp. B2-4-7]TPL42960.1 hypothetical protein FJ961_09800 [Mesorhizobium sp. B2-4-5]TPM76911.1 hypothetical protein FJ968_04145 [Mesorhizobium sp. B2-1-6]